MDEKHVKAFCHSAPIVFRDFSWVCSECKRDQVGFLGFLWWIAQKTETAAETLITKRKAVRKCGNCGQEGHSARKCPEKSPRASALDDDAEQL